MGGERSILLHGRPLGTFPALVPRCASATLLVFLGASAALVVVRRFVGALVHPLDPPMLLLAGLLTALVAGAVHLGWISGERTSGRLHFSVAFSVFFAAAALGIGLCVPGTSMIGAFLLFVPLVVEEGWAWTRHFRRFLPSRAPRSASISAPPLVTLPIDREEEIFPENVTQQLIRSQSAAGVEEVSGWLRIPFAALQRTGSAHVAFCPPFEVTPEVEVEQCDGPGARIKTAQLLPYGVRFDLKLTSASETPSSVLLQFVARQRRP